MNLSEFITVPCSIFKITLERKNLPIKDNSFEKKILNDDNPNLYIIKKYFSDYKNPKRN